ncbi:hopanoid biosynthesis-associated protein HpnK [Sphingomonas profundi]|uniref:hopanoid biosynthesis-associated protein HpnK n=1 Tax=Alterirhizorhabdus profundi TaxID=2681549 RepID=UPI0012E74827|nr:hopanoid biosynthesis-associated protein HpnK [Sphingomonas profundi]
MRRLIVTADDFGAAVAVNEAVEQAHRHGILTAASLMVAGAAVDDAVARARTMPALGVGLHLVLVDGRPVLPAARVPALVGRDGRFRDDMVRSAIRIFLDPAARAQLAAEIEAQFAAFAATGLPLDHVNAHKHFHLHPTIAATILRFGRRFGMAAVRAPIEPRGVLRRIERVPGRDVAAPWARRIGRGMRRAGMTVPDQVFGLAWSGAMDARRLGGLIDHLPAGLSEIYAHPATADDYPGHAPGYACRAELAALTDPAMAARLAARGVATGRFADFADSAGEGA